MAKDVAEDKKVLRCKITEWTNNRGSVLTLTKGPVKSDKYSYYSRALLLLSSTPIPSSEQAPIFNSS